MENKVGSMMPSDKEITYAVGELQALEQKLSRYTASLTPLQRREVPKIRPEAEPIVKLVAELARAHKLRLPGDSVDAMLADLQLAARMRPLQTAVARFAQMVDDTVLEAEGECWHTATAFYSILSSMAAHDPKLAQALEPATDFFAQGRRKPHLPAGE